MITRFLLHKRKKLKTKYYDVILSLKILSTKNNKIDLDLYLDLDLYINLYYITDVK